MRRFRFQRTRAGARRLLLAVVLASAVGCSHAADVTGKPPTGRRIPRTGDDMTQNTVQAEEPRTTSKPTREVSEGETLVGVVSDELYHRRDCKNLQGVAEADRIPLVSPYDGLDAGYFPCKDCDPGP